MVVEEAYSIGWRKLAEHGLTDWSFTFDNAKRRFGVCRARSKVISLSLPLTKLNNEREVLDTILHEVAHALAGPNAGHGYKWKLKAAEIGARAERCYQANVVVQPPHLYTVTCTACGTTGNRHRKPSHKMYCVICHKKSGAWNPLTWSKNVK